MKEDILDIPVECAFHVWEPFLSHKFDLELSPMLYYRICDICGKIELRDKMKEWNEMYGPKAKIKEK